MIFLSNMAITLHLLLLLSLGVQLSPADFLQRQKRNWIIQTLTIDEGYSGMFPYYLDQIDIDPSLNILEVTGQGIDEEPRDLLEIHEKSGRVYVVGPVDYEKYQILKLLIKGAGKNNQTVVRVGINVEITDANDNPPIFGQTTYETTIMESVLQGTGLINVTATDLDMTEKNRNFNFRIESVTPEPEDLEFFINEVPYFNTGTISFKGCLNSKKADKYTLIVTATDHGKPTALSSSTTVTINIEHGNRHHPVFTNKTGKVNVKEGLQGVVFSRLQVKDEDTRGTRAWKAKYEIHGDKNNSFRIVTDPQTNEGLLYVDKQLDFEKESLKDIIISVKNEIPYFTCKVIDRNTPGFWKIETDPSFFSGASNTEVSGEAGNLPLTVVIEDINEPPVFDFTKSVSVPENAEVGYCLGTFPARDPDVTGANQIRYIKGEDLANLFTVDPETGQINTSTLLDRESNFVDDGLYVITINAVDNGNPPLTGTGTLSIYIMDENDNPPSLIVNTFEMCQSDKPSWVNVSAVDPDDGPYGGPFWFTLIGDVKNNWRIDPEQGYSVKLIKEKKIYSGHHTLMLEVSDYQGKKALHSLTVVVCQCSVATRPDCRMQKSTGSRAGATAVGILFFCIILLTGLLFTSFMVSCKPQKVLMLDDDPVQNLMTGNTEEPGNDCRVPFELLKNKHHMQQMKVSEDVMLRMTPVSAVFCESVINSQACPNGLQSYPDRSSRRNSSSSREMSNEVSPSAMEIRRQQGTLRDSVLREIPHEALLFEAMNVMLEKLEAPGQELGDYEPTKYAYEGDLEHNFELDTISNPESPFDSEIELDSRFLELASICSPEMFHRSTTI
ncbi:PREDICTED: cadherin-like protein 26 isoform X3 [Cyprinodon variegatus]|uniref:cadherin-like protein 26 isoform X3 n=1 Tax=Cyprinodon variegatus TaxID=28743 RepID=UPI000742BB1D|nr:PREDICTED: cadherin-like protein 26 isoform X3 [Cyprinodon variegatus]